MRDIDNPISFYQVTLENQALWQTKQGFLSPQRLPFSRIIDKQFRRVFPSFIDPEHPQIDIYCSVLPNKFDSPLQYIPSRPLVATGHEKEYDVGIAKLDEWGYSHITDYFFRAPRLPQLWQRSIQLLKYTNMLRADNLFVHQLMRDVQLQSNASVEEFDSAVLHAVFRRESSQLDKLVARSGVVDRIDGIDSMAVFLGKQEKKGYYGQILKDARDDLEDFEIGARHLPEDDLQKFLTGSEDTLGVVNLSIGGGLFVVAFEMLLGSFLEPDFSSRAKFIAQLSALVGTFMILAAPNNLINESVRAYSKSYFHQGLRPAKLIQKG